MPAKRPPAARPLPAATKTAEGLGTAAPLVPPHPTVGALKHAAADCRACDLWKTGTRTVFGDGPETARVMMVGEQPGDEEDLAGKPFVGPAGKLLDRALVDTGIDRRQVYVTNTVKHFKWEPKGKRRIHKKPSGAEIRACRAWLDAEIETVEPDVIVLLGATAAQALLGKDFLVSQRRGEVVPGPGGHACFATVHPSSVLRARDQESRRVQHDLFLDDLRRLAAFLHSRR